LELVIQSCNELVLEMAAEMGLDRMGVDDNEDDSDEEDATAAPAIAAPTAIAPEVAAKEEEHPEMLILGREYPEALEIIFLDEEPEPL
jgi:hypothetical protein